jgi:hypothetical protein
LPTLQRRQAMRMKLVRGPIQAYLAHHLNILDLLSYITAGERPAAFEEIAESLRRSSERRAHSTEVLAQAVEAQRAILGIWIIRLDLQPTSAAQPSEGGAP